MFKGLQIYCILVLKQIFPWQFYNIIVLINKLTETSGNTGNSIFEINDNGFVLTIEISLTTGRNLLIASTSQG